MSSDRISEALQGKDSTKAVSTTMVTTTTTGTSTLSTQSKPGGSRSTSTSDEQLAETFDAIRTADAAAKPRREVIRARVI